MSHPARLRRSFLPLDVLPGGVQVHHDVDTHAVQLVVALAAGLASAIEARCDPPQIRQAGAFQLLGKGWSERLVRSASRRRFAGLRCRVVRRNRHYPNRE